MTSNWNASPLCVQSFVHHDVTGIDRVETIALFQSLRILLPASGFRLPQKNPFSVKGWANASRIDSRNGEPAPSFVSRNDRREEGRSLGSFNARGGDRRCATPHDSVRFGSGFGS